MSRDIERSLLVLDFAVLTRWAFTPSPAAWEDQVRRVKGDQFHLVFWHAPQPAAAARARGAIGGPSTRRMDVSRTAQNQNAGARS